VAERSKLIITVTSTRNNTTVNYVTQGSYRGLPTTDVARTIPVQGVLPSTGSKALWAQALSIVAADIAAGNGGGS
jgi:hypothetical protein